MNNLPNSDFSGLNKKGLELMELGKMPEIDPLSLLNPNKEKDYLILKEQIKPIEEKFKNINKNIENRKNFSNILRLYRSYSSVKLIDIVIGLFKTPDEFLKFTQKKYVDFILKSTNQENLIEILGFCKNTEDFMKFCNESVLCFFIKRIDNNFLKIILNITPNMDKLINCFKDRDITHELINIHDYNTSDTVFTKYSNNIAKFSNNTSDFIENFIKIYKDKDTSNIFKYANRYLKKTEIEKIFLNSKTLDDFVDICKKKQKEDTVFLKKNNTLDVDSSNNSTKFIVKKRDVYRMRDYGLWEKKADNISYYTGIYNGEIYKQYGHHISISDINNRNKYSIDYYNCTGLAVIGKSKKTGENISFLTHQDPVFLFSKDLYEGVSPEDYFETIFKEKIREIKEQSEEGSIEMIMFGGQKSENGKDEVKSLEFINKITNSFGNELKVFGGPENIKKGFFLNTVDRKLYLITDDNVENKKINSAEEAEKNLKK